MTDSNCQRWTILADRQAAGDSLDESDGNFYAEHVATCSDCAGEARVWAALGEVATKSDIIRPNPVSVGDRASPKQRPWKSARWRRRGAWALACFATTGVVTSAVGWMRHRRPSAVVLAPPSVSFALAAGEVHLGTRSVRAGEVLRAGERWRTEQGRACLAIETIPTACLDADSDASLSTLDPTRLSVRLERGRILSHVDEQAGSWRYTVVTSKARVTARGAEFLVSVAADQRVFVHLYAGSLSVEGPGHESREVTATSALIIDDVINVAAWPSTTVAADQNLLRVLRFLRVGPCTDLDIVTRPNAANVSVDDLLLGPTPITARVGAGRRLTVGLPGYATVTELLPTEPRERLQRHFELAEWSDPAAGRGLEPSLAHAKQATPTEGGHHDDPTPEDLLGRAHALRVQGKPQDAAVLYRQLLDSFPSSQEAHVAQVSLGELALSELGQAELALRSFEGYLQRPGPLTREAKFGRIRALQRLSRKAELRLAVSAFLKDYPNSAQAERLRSRSSSR